jgi:anaerobic ribonucleoside-triphosphate reductase activating protein
MIFTGFELSELQGAEASTLLELTDVLVAGRFIEDKRSEVLVWRGSTNQQVHFLSNRYSPSSLISAGDVGVELHLANNGEIVVTGFPTLPHLSCLPFS